MTIFWIFYFLVLGVICTISLISAFSSVSHMRRVTQIFKLRMELLDQIEDLNSAQIQSYIARRIPSVPELIWRYNAFSQVSFDDMLNYKNPRKSTDNFFVRTFVHIGPCLKVTDAELLSLYDDLSFLNPSYYKFQDGSSIVLSSENS